MASDADAIKVMMIVCVVSSFYNSKLNINSSLLCWKHFILANKKPEAITLVVISDNEMMIRRARDKLQIRFHLWR